ncbi:hypothetical protein ABNX05_22205 [Lysinibacillus sp. M3]|uniref:Uncharacterized protein n=1 Tax=Lysinibacillus zambalensis TaxID=3160866 RepID=A0ABV1MXW7_9BACI
MKNEDSLYFDLYRKTNFDKLIKVFTSAAGSFPVKADMQINLGKYLELYLGTAGTYDGSQKKWGSTYTPGIELGVMSKSEQSTIYEISPLAKALLKSEITSDEYLTIYFLNFVQLINSKFISPLEEVLLVLSARPIIDKEDIKAISNFRLSQRSTKNQDQIANSLLTRLVNAKILKIVNEIRGSKTYSIGDKYSIDDLLKNLNKFNGSVSNYEKLEQSDFLTLISQPNKLIYKYSL